jgi:hypothetical protein
MFGLFAEEVNPFGPLQEYVAPAVVFTDNFSESPEHTGELLEAVAVTAGLTVTVELAVLLEQPEIE